jgi:hypothetical protein
LVGLWNMFFFGGGFVFQKTNDMKHVGLWKIGLWNMLVLFSRKHMTWRLTRWKISVWIPIGTRDEVRPQHSLDHLQVARTGASVPFQPIVDVFSNFFSWPAENGRRFCFWWRRRHWFWWRNYSHL